MAHMILGIGYQRIEQSAVRNQWHKYDIGFHFVNSTEEAIRALRKVTYICVTVSSRHIKSEQLEILRSIKPVPIIVLSPVCTVTERAKYLHRGAAEYFLKSNHYQNTQFGDKDAIQQYLDIQDRINESLTLIANEDIYFCLEYRLVEIRGKPVRLTEKEFNVLALLIMHPKRVFTFEIIMQLVWGEEYSDASRQMLWSHISRLRHKMLVESDVPQYIENVRGVGYRYNPGDTEKNDVSGKEKEKRSFLTVK